MLYEFKGSNGKIELYENKIVIIRNAFSVMARGSKEIYIKNLTGVQIKKPGLTAGYIQFIFSGSKEVKSSNIMDAAYDENTVVFQANGYQDALALKQKIEDLIARPVITGNQQVNNVQATSQADELIKFKQLLDSGAISEEEFKVQKDRILASSESNITFNNTPTYEEPKYEQHKNTCSTNKKKDKKDKKKTILLLVISILFLIGLSIAISENSNTSNTTNSNIETTIKSDQVSLSDIKEWYENQMPNVSQSFIDYAKSVDGISAINVSDSKFRFGEDSGWYDCHYTIYFTCKINGEVHSGESRAFLKYNDNDINFFHFEIFDNDGIVSVVEHYDEEYDEIIENYYKELIKSYK